MSRTMQIAPVRKSVVVDASTMRAFEVFTNGIDRWWPRSHGIGNTMLRETHIEPFVGGRWYSKHTGGEEATIGHVRVWQPGECLVVSWEINAAWKPEARVTLASEVEVRFVAEGPTRTRVELEHRDFEKMAGDGGDKMRGAVEGGWPGILAIYAAAFTDGAQP
jgi:uncharacterized protein YndB with AHSA1/START domain